MSDKTSASHYLLVPVSILALLATFCANGCLDRSSADLNDTSVSDTAPVVKSEQDLRDRIDRNIDFTSHQRLMTTRDQAAWQIIHGIEAFGSELQIENDGQTVGALKYLMDGGLMKGWVIRPGEDDIRNKLAGAKPGTGSLPKEQGLIAVLEAGSKTGEGHPDQWIGYFSQCGVKADDPLVLGNKTYHVRDLMYQAQWQVYDGMEATWTLMAAVQWLPLNETWKAKGDDKPWSIERIVAMEADAPFDLESCGRTHRLYALAQAVNRYQKETGKSPDQMTGVWKRAWDRVALAKKRARQFQQPDGAFSAGFFVNDRSSNELTARLHSTGHTLEFLDVTLDQQELSEGWVVDGVVALCRMMEEMQTMDVECGALYHATHALRLYRDARWPKNGGQTAGN